MGQRGEPCGYGSGIKLRKRKQMSRQRYFKCVNFFSGAHGIFNGSK